VHRDKSADVRYDVLVVGAGAAGAPLAARLSEDPSRTVLLLEAGPVPASTETFPEELLNAGTVQGAMPDYPHNWSLMGYLTPDLPYSIARGRILGGSTAISGTYFIRAPKLDFDRWSSEGNEEWAWDKVLPFYKKLEDDLDYGESGVHGGLGPMTISRPPQEHPVTKAFRRAVKELGFPMERDKNCDAEPGYGPMPSNSICGLRINTGIAYINPVRDRQNLTVEGNSYVRRVLFEGTHAVGVEVLRDGRILTIEANEIVLSAGAVKTPHILLLSGLGPETELNRFHIPVIKHLPGVGKDFSDHPNLAITWRSKVPLVDYGTAHSMASVLNFTASGSPSSGDLEILPLLKPMVSMLTGSQPSAPNGSQKPAHVLHQGDLAFLVSLQAATSRGQITLESADPGRQPRIHFNYFATETDLRRMREAVRTAVRLLRSDAFSPIFQELTELTEPILQNDMLLNRWMRSRLGTAIHLCGSAKFGSPNNPESVVDQYGRVHGVKGLRVADTSILPTTPTRGPAATAVLIGERIAEFIRVEALDL
jgi:choline dehydrogenase